MVLLGGLEIVAAGYVLNELSKDKQNGKRTASQPAQRRRKRRDSSNSHRPRPSQQNLMPPQPVGLSRPTSAPPQQFAPSRVNSVPPVQGNLAPGSHLKPPSSAVPHNSAYAGTVSQMYFDTKTGKWQSGMLPAELPGSDAKGMSDHHSPSRPRGRSQRQRAYSSGSDGYSDGSSDASAGLAYGSLPGPKRHVHDSAMLLKADGAPSKDMLVVAPRPRSAASPPPPSAPKSSSKKRAKARRDREDLRALLARPTTASSSSHTFDLMDFMKTPGELGVYEIESLCMNCRDNGITKILPIKIPHFKDVLLESFDCDKCGFHNSTVKDAGQIQEKGAKYRFRIETPQDLQRQVVRGDNGVLRIEDLELETPPAPGQLTNLEGVFGKIIGDLEADQPARKEAQPDMYKAVEAVLAQLRGYVEGKNLPVTVSLDDPSGNSFIEPSTADFSKAAENVEHAEDAEDGGGMDGVDIVDGEVYELPAECPACGKPCTVNMRKTKIPHFKEVIIMATNCDHCGYRTSDVKTGGEVPEKGRRITLQVRSLEDVSRDILKSETCALKSQALGLEVHAGTLGGRFTTVEGLLTDVRDQLHGQIFDVDGDLAGGDSITAETRSKWNAFFDKLDKAIKAEVEFDIILEDPLANSFVQEARDNDPQVESEDYERTAEEMEELGLNDMKTEGYEQDAETAADETNGKRNGISRTQKLPMRPAEWYEQDAETADETNGKEKHGL
ncbi:hypothetical protein DV737_g4729, partial [Chaetothyriales sp. CBS 132003]